MRMCFVTIFNRHDRLLTGKRSQTKWTIRICLVLVMLLAVMSLGRISVLCAAVGREIPEEEGITGFGLALRKLSTVGSVLYVTAHPDDENNALLAKLSRGMGYRTGLLTLTRGSGGQNEIGPELFEDLGALRTQELMSVHRFDGVEQFFTRAYEFGYSFSVEETLQKWDRNEILSDIVRVIRLFRPHVVITMNPTGSGGGQHHQASAQLAIEAFRLAGDPSQFPEQLREGLRTWRPLRLFQAAGYGRGSRGDVNIDLGAYDPLLGESYIQFGARARNNHRSQGMNSLATPYPIRSGFFLVNSRVDSFRLEDDFFDQMDVGLQSLSSLDPALESSIILLEGYVDWATDAFIRSDFDSARKGIMTGLDHVRRMIRATRDEETLFLLRQKEKDFLRAAEKSHYLYVDALKVGEDATVVPGEEFEIRVFFRSFQPEEIQPERIELITPTGWEILDERETEFGRIFRVKVGEDALLSQPFWFRPDPTVDRYSVREGFSGIEAVPPPPVKALVRYRSFGVPASVERAVQFRWFDSRAGRERRAGLKVVPKLSVRLTPGLCISPVSRPKSCRFKVEITNNSPHPKKGTVTLSAPPGLSASPRSRVVSLRRENETKVLDWTVKPGNRISSGTYTISTSVESDGETFSLTQHLIDYPHVQQFNILKPAESTIRVFPFSLPPGLKVGYVMGVGDGVGQATEQLGAAIHYMTAEDLSSRPLSGYDVIILGVRAYLNRFDLISNNTRLLEYVRNGGHLVVQYNKYEFLRDNYAPYPVNIRRPHDRVTVEDSPVKVLAPQHPIFNFPNRIGPADWEGWVQERGLYFLSEWDEHFTPLLELRDPWPYNDSPKQGSLLVAQYGKGTYIFTGLAFFRQLPAGVPGAYRIWANIISLGRTSRP